MPFPPPVVIDECLPKSLADFFADRGYEVHTVGISFPRSSPDVSVAAVALAKGGVVVTHDSDFRRRKKRPPVGAEMQVNDVDVETGEALSQNRIQKADRIYFKDCSHANALSRIIELIDIIETEYKVIKTANKKFMMHITKNSYTVHR